MTAPARETTPAVAAVVPVPAFDEDGFLADPATWTPELARQIARLDGVPYLTDRHWLVIELVRARAARVGAAPAMRSVCRAAHSSKEEIYRLFGGCLAVWRIAGLANPGEEAKAYMR